MFMAIYKDRSWLFIKTAHGCLLRPLRLFTKTVYVYLQKPFMTTHHERFLPFVLDRRDERHRLSLDR